MTTCETTSSAAILPLSFPEMQMDTDCKLILGNCLQELPKLPDNSIDTCITDPPYELGFMGKSWDSSGVAFDPNTWRSVYRVLKPGAFLLCFGGTRTFHRITCAIEDAGFEIRDCMMWLYGSGFPKSLDISKAIDKLARGKVVLAKIRHFREERGWTRLQLGEACRFSDPEKTVWDWEEGGHVPSDDNYSLVVAALGITPEEEKAFEREVIGRKTKARSEAGSSALPTCGAATVYDSWDVTAPVTESAKLWDGWGTALKPAHEDILVAQKPFDLSQLCGILAHTILQSVCQLPSHAKAAGCSSVLIPNGRDGVVDSALWSAVEKCSTVVDLCGVMATLPSASETPISLNIVSSWLATLAAISSRQNTFTTETRSSLTTDLRILLSSRCEITPDTIIEAATGRRGTGSSASLVPSIFTAVAARLDCILDPSALDDATSKVGGKDLSPKWEPIIVAMKPTDGTFAENALKHGVAGLNIDGGRIPTDEKITNHSRSAAAAVRKGVFHGNKAQQTHQTAGQELGRFPANLLLDEEAAKQLDQQSGTLTSGKPCGVRKEQNKVYGQYAPGQPLTGFGDSGGASRFFYCAKASRGERPVYLRCNCETVNLSAWKRQDRNPNGQTDAMSPPKDICEDCSGDGCDSCMTTSGNSTTAQSPKDSKFTTRTKTSSTTKSTTFNSSPRPSTNDSTVDANYEMVPGGSHVNDAENQGPSMPRTGTSPARAGRSMGVVVDATSASLYTQNVCDACGERVRTEGHPTQKPIKLMEYLCTLTKTPTGGSVLDPFLGSGSTAVAALNTGRKIVGIEMSPEYLEIAKARVKAVQPKLLAA